MGFRNTQASSELRHGHPCVVETPNDRSVVSMFQRRGAGYGRNLIVKVLSTLSGSRLSTEIPRNLCDRPRRRPIAYQLHIKIELPHLLQGSPHGGVNPVVMITESAPAKLGKQNDVRRAAFGVQ